MILVLAAPAVGAPSIASAVVQQMRRALCIAGLDICDARMAAEAGLAPCPMKTDITGHEATATAFSIELGHRLTLTVTPNSDGTVTVLRSATGIAGGSAGFGGRPVTRADHVRGRRLGQPHRPHPGRARLGVPGQGRR